MVEEKIIDTIEMKKDEEIQKEETIKLEIEAKEETKVEEPQEKSKVTESGIDLEQARLNLEQVLAAARADLEKTRKGNKEEKEEALVTTAKPEQKDSESKKSETKTPKPKSARGRKRKTQE